MKKAKVISLHFEIPKGAKPVPCLHCGKGVYWVDLTGQIQMAISEDGDTHEIRGQAHADFTIALKDCK